MVKEFVSGRPEPTPSFGLTQKKQKIKARLHPLGSRCKAAQCACATRSLRIAQTCSAGLLCVYTTSRQGGSARADNCRGASPLINSDASRPMAGSWPCGVNLARVLYKPTSYPSRGPFNKPGLYAVGERSGLAIRRRLWVLHTPPKRMTPALIFLPTFWIKPKSRWLVPAIENKGSA